MVSAMIAHDRATYIDNSYYVLAVRRPTVTIVMFFVLALATYSLSKYLNSENKRIAITFSQTPLFIGSLGF